MNVKTVLTRNFAAGNKTHFPFSSLQPHVDLNGTQTQMCSDYAKQNTVSQISDPNGLPSWMVKQAVNNPAKLMISIINSTLEPCFTSHCF